MKEKVGVRSCHGCFEGWKKKEIDKNENVLSYFVGVEL